MKPRLSSEKLPLSKAKKKKHGKKGNDQFRRKDDSKRKTTRVWQVESRVLDKTHHNQSTLPQAKKENEGQRRVPKRLRTKQKKLFFHFYVECKLKESTNTQQKNKKTLFSAELRAFSALFFRSRTQFCHGKQYSGSGGELIVPLGSHVCSRLARRRSQGSVRSPIFRVFFFSVNPKRENNLSQERPEKRSQTKRLFKTAFCSDLLKGTPLLPTPSSEQRLGLDKRWTVKKRMCPCVSSPPGEIPHTHTLFFTSFKVTLIFRGD